VIVSSGRLDERALADCKALGILHTLEKPFTEGTLAATLSRALSDRIVSTD